MNNKKPEFFNSYFKDLYEKVNSFERRKLEECLKTFRYVSQYGRKILIFGNGGSSGIASHFAVDLMKTANVRCLSFNEAGLLTCYGNDFGYEYWVQKAIEHYIDKGDVVILISSSGQSMNMVNAAKFLSNNALCHKLITLTGFKQDNPLRKLGHINLYVNSNKYNIVENTHQIWLLSIIDKYILEAEA